MGEEIMADGKPQPAETAKDERYKKKLEAAVDVHQKALDDLVSVNSLFTAAVFVGLAVASAGQQNVEGNKLCEAGVHVARRLVKNEVISFACYLLSSLVAKALKTHLFTYLKGPQENLDRWPKKALRGTLFTLSALTSIIGGVFLLYSMVDMIQLRLGKIACKSTETMHAVGALIAVNGLALVIYVPFVLHAIFNSTKIFNDLAK
ncbi:hypothetical protein EUGRSUZ_A00234 [Eucalyptus grandis]|uniref:Uncharacterized protein n=2 Tax=Eucalyptus grandis TaxID=71139 RepID=A0ACC3LYK6_EUCGR|nr:hypothetical protein EUGRSUZ_A00234 [Eucalyptus grandis]